MLLQHTDRCSHNRPHVRMAVAATWVVVDYPDCGETEEYAL
jgi:hypothetical protein